MTRSSTAFEPDADADDDMGIDMGIVIPAIACSWPPLRGEPKPNAAAVTASASTMSKVRVVFRFFTFSPSVVG